MKIDLNGAIVFSQDCSIYEVYSIIIDNNEKTIECNDINGFTIAMIHYEESDECGYINYDDEEGNMPYAEEIVENGEVVI